MKVFISWSGDLSNAIASEFRTWLPGALQSVKPYFTPSDIEKGAKWNSEISKELELSDIGILFVTRENLNSAWLNGTNLSRKRRKSRHSRAGGNPGVPQKPLDSRLRGNDSL